MRVEDFLRRIDEEMVAFARDALKAPPGKEVFDYGRSVGIYAGLEQARDILIAMVKDVEARDHEL